MVSNTQYDKESADEWLDKVDDITKRVQDIIAGNVDAIEEEEKFQKDMELKKVKKEIRAREASEQLAKGIKGKGFKGNFKTFCKGCHTEYHHEAIEVCNNCGQDTVTNEVSNSLNL